MPLLQADELTRCLNQYCMVLDCSDSKPARRDLIAGAVGQELGDTETEIRSV